MRWVDRRYSPGARITPLSYTRSLVYSFAISKERHIIAAERRPSLRRRQRSYLVRARSPEMDTRRREEKCTTVLTVFVPRTLSLCMAVHLRTTVKKIKNKKKILGQLSFDERPLCFVLLLRQRISLEFFGYGRSTVSNTVEELIARCIMPPVDRETSPRERSRYRFRISLRFHIPIRRS